MPTPKITLPVQQAGFSLGPAGGVLSAKLDGGRSRRRRDVVGGTRQVSLNWNLDDGEFDYFQAVLDELDGGALPFFIDLCLNGSTVQECLATFDPDSITVSVDGLFQVAASLEVVPGSQSSLPMPPTVLEIPSPCTADEIPVSVTCDWTTDTITVFLDGILVATLPRTSLVCTAILSGVADGNHTVTAKATNSAGTSVASAGVSFYVGTAAAAASFTLDGMELFDDA